jgi:signal transduction histidine kinase
MTQREIQVRDAFLVQLSRGLERRVAALGTCRCRGLDQLRNFSRELSIICGDEQALKPRRQPMELGDWIGGVVRHWGKRFAKHPGIRVSQTGDTRGAFDPALLESVVAELLSNALKYGGANEVQVQIEGGPKSIRITIADRGPGLGPDPRRGRRFARGTRARKSGGFGIGVWLTRRIVRAHGGRFRLASPESGGTRAIVELPRRSRVHSRA